MKKIKKLKSKIIYLSIITIIIVSVFSININASYLNLGVNNVARMAMYVSNINENELHWESINFTINNDSITTNHNGISTDAYYQTLMVFIIDSIDIKTFDIEFKAKTTNDAFQILNNSVSNSYITFNTSSQFFMNAKINNGYNSYEYHISNLDRNECTQINVVFEYKGFYNELNIYDFSLSINNQSYKVVNNLNEKSKTMLEDVEEYESTIEEFKPNDNDVENIVDYPTLIINNIENNTDQYIWFGKSIFDLPLFIEVILAACGFMLIAFILYGKAR